jgi:hypothetical protein
MFHHELILLDQITNYRCLSDLYYLLHEFSLLQINNKLNNIYEMQGTIVTGINIFYQL